MSAPGRRIGPLRSPSRYVEGTPSQDFPAAAHAPLYEKCVDFRNESGKFISN